MVYDATVFVCERPKTEDVCNGFFVVIVNDVQAHTSPICGARIWQVRDVWLDIDRHSFNYWHRICVFGMLGLTLGRVLLMPWRGRFMWPFAVAVLGFRYFSTSVSFILGHPLRNPRRTALRSEEILGLHRDWCANLTAFA